MKKTLYIGLLSLGVLALSYVPAFGQSTSGQFNTSLTFGMRNNSEVVKLQQFLIDQGFLKNSTATGNFLSLTKQAVIDFQSAHSISPIGIFGPLTRAAANSLLASSVAVNTTVGVQSVSATNSLVAAVGLSNSRTITWHTTNYPAGVGVNINLLKKSDSSNSYSLVRSIATDAPNTGSFTWTPQTGETGSALYVEVTCSTTHTFTGGCAINSAPVQVM